MKKRILASIVALMMMTMGLTVCAANSPSASDAAAAAQAADTVSVSVGYMSFNARDVSVTAKTADGASVAVSVSYATHSQDDVVAAVKEKCADKASATILKVINITPPADYVPGTPVTLDVPDAAKGATAVIHFGAVTERIPVVNNQFTTQSFSDFAFVVETEKATSTPASSSNLTGDAWVQAVVAAQYAQIQGSQPAAAPAAVVASPKTGEK